MSQNKYRTTLPYNAVQGLHQLITTIINQTTNPDDDDKLLLATLNEIRLRLYTKLGDYKKEYRLSFTPPHAIALRLLYTQYLDETGNATSYIGNQLHTIANDVHRLCF